MKIGIDGGSLSNRRGFGRFAGQLLAALADLPTHHDFFVVIDSPSRGQVPLPSRFRVVEAPVKVAPSRAASARGRRSAWDMLAMGRAMAKEAPDVAFFPASYSAFPAWNYRKLVVTVHDTLALAHPELVFPTRAGRYAWALKEYASVSRAHRVLTVSEASRRDLISWFKIDPGRVGVVSEAPAPVFRPTTPGPVSDQILGHYRIPAGSRFLLYVGGMSPHKNLPRLVEAFGKVAGGLTSTLLVLVGDHSDVFHTQVPAIREAIARAGLEGRVLLPGFVPDAELSHLYGRAFALVQPSLMEGFGLPALEAMACGTPVISSRAGSLPEVIGEGGVFFDPTEVDEIGRAIRSLLEDPDERDRLGRLALRRARQFTWANAARSLLAEFDSLESDLPKRRSA
ncbi:MAG: glycosyltransferase family 1 protein [Isosphaeraceae bacterium]